MIPGLVRDEGNPHQIRERNGVEIGGRIKGGHDEDCDRWAAATLKEIEDFALRGNRWWHHFELAERHASSHQHPPWKHAHVIQKNRNSDTPLRPTDPHRGAGPHTVLPGLDVPAFGVTAGNARLTTRRDTSSMSPKARHGKRHVRSLRAHSHSGSREGSGWRRQSCW